jgi:hypothetical protein
MVLRRNITRHPLLFLAACTIACYAPSFFDPFQFDDFGVIVNESAVHSFTAWREAAGSGLRPLLKLTYTFNWVTGLGPPGFHLLNLIIHWANVLLIAALCSTAIRRGSEDTGFSFSTCWFAAAFLFALHPVQTEAVTYICGRSASLMTFWYCASLLCYIRGIRSGRPLLWAGAAPLLFMAAVLTKEAAMTLPAALLIWEICIEKTKARLLLTRQLVWWTLLAIPCYYVIMHPGYYRLLYGVVGERSFDEALLYQVKGVFYLLSRLVMINRLSIEPGLGSHPPGAAPALIESILLLVISASALAVRRKLPAVSFGILWFLLHTFIPYVFLPRRDVLNEHHMYLANAGLFCAIGYLSGILWEMPRWRKFINPAMTVVCCLLMVQTVLRNLDYRSEVALWESTIRVSPDSPTAYNNLGVAYQLAGRLPEARLAYTRALMREPAFDKARRNLEKLLRSEQAPTR